MRTSLLIVLALLHVAAGCVDTSSGSSSAQSQEAEPLRAFTYEESTAGLEALFTDMMEKFAAGDRAAANALVQSFQLDAPEDWFGNVFGAELGPELAQEYGPMRGQFLQLADLLAGLHKAGQTRVMVERFDKSDDDAAVAYQAAALGRMVKPVPLYSVRLFDKTGTKVFHVWSFAYQAGWFRWIGKTRSAVDGADEAAPDEVDVREYRVRDMEKARAAMQ